MHRPVPSLQDSDRLAKGTQSVPTCRDMSELVTDYMERATPIRTRVDMWLHLWRCEACRRYFDQVRRTAILLGSHRVGVPPQGTEDGLLAAARGQRQHDP
jgi:predicted anti-sigma-YlaC factor YlaD